MAQTLDKTVSAITEQSTELQKVGYSFGYLSGRDGKDVLDDLDLDAFEQGMVLVQIKNLH